MQLLLDVQGYGYYLGCQRQFMSINLGIYLCLITQTVTVMCPTNVLNTMATSKNFGYSKPAMRDRLMKCNPYIGLYKHEGALKLG